MRKVFLTLLAAGVVGAYLSGPGVAQPPAAGESVTAGLPAYKAPRGPGGKPDLSGVWQVMNTANWDVEAHGPRHALQTRAGPSGPIPARMVLAMGAIGAVPGGAGVVVGGAIPYTPEALALRNENRAQNITVVDKGLKTEHFKARDPEINCYLPGIPRGTYMDLPFQIFHSDTSMMMAYEYAGAVRNIQFKDPGPAQVDSWMGQSVGKWEGDTLVVTVTGQIDRTWFDRSGNHHSSEMKVVERFTPIGPYHMRYEAEITDPATFTRPWKMSMILYKRIGDDARLQQFKCVEFVEEMIFGHLRREPLTGY